ncbi:YybH family protein [Streptomyces sp. NPDC059755]
MTNNNSTADAVGVVEAYMQALQIKDTDTILRLYADEAEIIPENLPSLRGRDAVDSFYASTFAAIGMEVNVEVVST